MDSLQVELQIDRRKFLKRLGFGAAAVVAAPKAIEAVCSCASGFKPLIGSAEEWCDIHGTPLVECMPVLKDYVEYTNFSQFANCQEIDDLVMQAAKELSESFGKRVDYAAAASYQPVAFGRNW